MITITYYMMIIIMMMMMTTGAHRKPNSKGTQPGRMLASKQAGNSTGSPTGEHQATRVTLQA